MKKTVVVAIVSAVGLCAIIFWIAFAIIAYRNETYVFELKKGGCSDEPYLIHNNIYYYTDCYDEVEVAKLRLFFKTDKKELKEIIKDGELISLLNQLNIYKYQFNQGLETKYYNDDKTFVITRCEYWQSKEDRVDYIISGNYVPFNCNGRYYK